MTGGVGFSKQGKDSFKENRNLRIARPSMKDNPYAAKNASSHQELAENYEELKTWKIQKESNDQKRRLIIYISLFVVFLIGLLLAII
ncbi:MAG: hypothetical protein EA341_05595 [Mongoliibacter sp.]|uniref:hypothetical protein n=1 Tax=Mongoliibacter sp. TaxID=2022438 RepID=UPI0012EF79C5|nr:hypothetical protein [Mongoliibacter sp.]TVP51318.1 MAG: hypothetical protein EA341_05595 [Mongoliibacter sp.]